MAYESTTHVLSKLDTEFRIKVNELLRIAEQEQLELSVYCGLRTCAEQAKLFRSTRGGDEISQKKQSLKDRGFGFLADVLDSVGPTPGKMGAHVTKAGPGESWHQYGMAVDCVPLFCGKAMWEDSFDGWKTYGQIARHVGLTWAGDWTSFREFPHIQMSVTSSPLTELRTPALVACRLREVGSL